MKIYASYVIFFNILSGIHNVFCSLEMTSHSEIYKYQKGRYYVFGFLPIL